LWIIFAQEAWMLVTGYVLAGLAVGADVPASWTLIAQTAPDKERGKHAGVAQVLWMMGPVIVLLMAFALSGLAVLGVPRYQLGIWSFFGPAITKAGFHTLAWILTGFVAASALLGLLFAPSNAGKSLDQIQRERGGDGDGYGDTSRGSPASEPARACRRSPDQRGLIARMVEPIAPNFAALRRVSSKAERA
jgi:hypothetical protein